MALFTRLLLLLLLLLQLLLVAAPVTDASPPFIPPTCYSKVLSMAQEATNWAAYLQNHYETARCMAHMPDLRMDVHNACVMYKMRTYISLLEGLRDRRCSYTRDVQRLGHTLRQLFIIMSQKCHGDLVFTVYDCAALEGPARGYY